MKKRLMSSIFILLFTLSGAEAKAADYLGRIVNKSTEQVIEIRCAERTQAGCKTIGFFLINGESDVNPFFIVANRDLGQALQKEGKKYKYSRASRWWVNLVSSDDESAALGILPFSPVLWAGIACLIVDVAITPYSINAYLAPKRQLKKARRAIFKALAETGVVRVSEKQFQAIINLANLN